MGTSESHPMPNRDIHRHRQTCTRPLEITTLSPLTHNTHTLTHALSSPAQAIRLDEVAEGNLTSSMVDDVFFVLLKSGRRAMGTGKAPSVVAILNSLNALLAGQFRAALAAKLAGAPGRLAAAAPAEEHGAPAAGASAAALAFNNADVSAGYVSKLREQLEGLAGQLFAAPNDRDRIKMVGGGQGGVE